MLHAFFKPELEEFIRANFAATLKENGKEAEALETAKPVCATASDIRGELAKRALPLAPYRASVSHPVRTAA